MSYYYNYYIGYENEGKIYPLGPYDCFGELIPVVSKSRSFASDLHYDFYDVPEAKISDELRKKFTYKNWENEDECQVKYLYLNDLPSDVFIRKGYFLIEDVHEYENDPYDFDGFYNHLEPVVYTAMLQKEIQFGRQKTYADKYGNEDEDYNASDYMYYAYPDYNSKAYEVFKIKEIANIYTFGSSLPSDSKLVVLEDEG